MTVVGYDLEGGIELYQVTILQKVDMERYSCKIIFNISCTVGSLNYTLHAGQLDLCEGHYICFMFKRFLLLQKEVFRYSYLETAYV